MPTIAEYYEFAKLATAAYVKPTIGVAGPSFAADANDQGRLPLNLANQVFVLDTTTNPSPWSIPSPGAYQGNDGTGFAATLFQKGSQKVLAMRGTEAPPGGTLGDFALDMVNNLGGIGFLGLALPQAVSMVNLLLRLNRGTDEPVAQYRWDYSLTTPVGVPSIPIAGGAVYLFLAPAISQPGLNLLAPGETIAVTGHSLGGHLAALAARLFPGLVSSAYAYNAPGFDPSFSGGIVGAIAGFISRGPLGALAGAIGGAPLALKLAEPIVNTLFAPVLPGAPAGAFGGSNIYVLESEDSAPGDDTTLVATVITGAQALGQEVFVTTEVNSHLIEPFMDALSMHALFGSMNANLTLADTNRLMEAASKDPVAGEETLLRSIYKLVKGKELALGDPRLSDATGILLIGKGDTIARDTYYARIVELEREIKLNPAWSIRSLIGIPADQLRNLAMNGDADAKAYRYALMNLNAFAILGPSSLYDTPRQVGVAAHNANGKLNLFVDAVSTPAGMTTEYLTDRAAFLARKNAAHTVDVTTILDAAFVAGERLRYADLASGVTVTVSNAVLPPNDDSTKRFVFGGDTADAVSGGSYADRLYGGTGSDFMAGGKSDDYLEGGAGLDVYQYNATAGFLGLFPGNDGNDEIRDTDGKGVLRYTHDGVTRLIGGAAIKQSATQWLGAEGKFRYDRNGADLVVTILGDAGGTIRITDFDFTAAAQSGYMGIGLREAPVAIQNPVRIFEGDTANWDSDPQEDGVQIQYDFFGNIIRADGQGRPYVAQPDRQDFFNGSASTEVERFVTGDGLDEVYADGPDSFTSPAGGRDLIETGPGRDVAVAGGGNDWLEGGTGGDLLVGGAGDDVIYAGTSNGQTLTIAAAVAAGEAGEASAEVGDLLTGDGGSDVLIGSAAADLLAGGEEADIVVGGLGDDTIYGDRSILGSSTNWVLQRTVSGSGAVPLYLVTTTDVVFSSEPAVGGADVIYGGAGKDWIFAGAGDDPHNPRSEGRRAACRSLGRESGCRLC